MGWLGQMLDQVGWLCHLVTWLPLMGGLGQMAWSDVRPGWLCHLVTWLTPDEMAWSDGLVRC
jgi:hypothetical protein